MESKQIIEQVKECKGTNVRCIWRRNMKTRKGVLQIVEKETETSIRAGIDFANLGAVKDGIESGERGEVQPLPWGHWKEFPFIIAHTPKGQTEEIDYVRLYPSSFGNIKTHVRYFINGVVSTEEQTKELTLASEFRETDEPILCYTVKAKDVITIG